MDQRTVIEDDLVVSMEYTLHVDGKIVDTSNGKEPIEFLQGGGEIVYGLEQALYGMAAGESKRVVVVAEEGYGDVDAEAYGEFPLREFPEDVPLEPGVELNIRDESGHSFEATVESVDKETVRLNFNHPLAGKELRFDVTVVGMRPATKEELSHGHAHDAHSH